MKRRQQKQKGKKPRKKTEPLAEGIIPLDSRGMRSWKSMSDGEIVRHAKSVVEEKRLKKRDELKRADSGLYAILCKRKLVGEVFPDLKRPDGFFSRMSNDDLVGYACRIIREKGLERRSALEKADSGLYEALRKRGLLDKIGLERMLRDWVSMSDGEIIDYAQRYLKENRISGKRELQKADSGLYEVLKKRKLLDRVGFEEKQRHWKSMSDEELVKHAKRYLEENTISGRIELEKADKGLYLALRKRKLLDRVGFEDKRRPRRDWKSMSYEEFVEHAQEFVKENGISRRIELRKADSGMYGALEVRGLLDRVFAPIEADCKAEAVQDVVDAMKEFDA